MMRVVNVAVLHLRTISAILCGTIYMRNPVHQTHSIRLVTPSTRSPVSLSIPAITEVAPTEEVHVDAAANYRMHLRLPTSSDYLLRRFKDVHCMHIGSYERYALYETRKEAAGSARPQARAVGASSTIAPTPERLKRQLKLK
jgi:hypothetical protein